MKQYETMRVVIKSKLTTYPIAGTVHPPYYVSKMFWPNTSGSTEVLHTLLQAGSVKCV